MKVVKKIIKVEVKNRKNRKIRSQRSLVVLHLRSLIGGRIRRASSVVSHVCDPNDIRHAFDMYHYARYIREWRPHDLIYVREAVHRERHEEGADRQRPRLGRTWSVSNASKRSQMVHPHCTHACADPNTSHSAHQRAVASHIRWTGSFTCP